MVLVDTDSLISGPIKTSRLGNTLGFDVGSSEVNIVVSRELRVPRASILVTTAAQNMIRLSKAGDKVDNIVVVSSSSDPTRHPEFKPITENLRDLRNKWYPKAKLCLFSDNPDLGTSAARTALGIYDRPFLRLEWGTSKTYAALTKNKSTQLTTLMTQLKSLERFVVQASFVRGKVDNSTENEVKGWIKRLDEVRPTEVQIIVPESLPTGLRAAPKSRIEKIAAQVTDATGLAVTIIAEEPIFLAATTPA